MQYHDLSSSFCLNLTNSNRTEEQAQPPPVSTFWTILCLSPVVIVFFLAGIFVGSKFVEEGSQTLAVPSIGLPNTYNIVEKWNKPASNLRGQVKFITDVAPKTAPRALVADIGTVPEAHSNNNVALAHTNPPLGVKEGESHPVTGSELAPRLKSSLHVTSNSLMKGPSGIDSDGILVASWVYLDPIGSENDMRTIFTNKKSGCEKSEEQYGLSMYVNAWQTNDHRLYVEYGGLESGCQKIDSNGIELIPEKWYHVAVFLGDHTARLYIDGSEVGSTTHIETHQLQRSRPLLIGQYDHSEFPLFGNISHFAIVHLSAQADSDSVAKNVRSVMNIDEAISTPGIYALYTMEDAASEMPNSVCLDSVGGHSGTYVFPAVGKVVSGVKQSLVDGVGGRPVTAEMQALSDKLGHERKAKIKDGMKFAWSNYKQYAWGRDELKPVSGTGSDPWGNMGMTLLDSLDTLYLMGMREEFEEAREWVERSLTFSRAGSVSVFETTIRALGGLLAAFDLSKDKVFLTKARELADLLMPAFATRSGIPHGMVDLRSHSAGGGWSGDNAILSELGTLQVEFRYLSHHTGMPEYESQSMKALQVMHSKNPANGLFPIKVNINDGNFADSHVTFGALGDSFYEYLLKVWLQGDKKESWLREMYDKAIDGVVDVLLATSSQSGLLFIADWNGSGQQRKMDHLVCFMPGIMTLGAYTDPKGLSGTRAKRDLAVAKALMYTCREMYHRQVSGIAPEYVEFPTGDDMKVAGGAPFFILRPETAESLFVMNQLTGDPIYRDWAWEIWEAIESECRTRHGYGAIKDVRVSHSGIDDRMESFFLAETIKYLYLAQDPDKPVDLMTKVFNTEAHPLSIFDSTHKPIHG